MLRQIQAVLFPILDPCSASIPTLRPLLEEKGKGKGGRWLGWIIRE